MNPKRDEQGQADGQGNDKDKFPHHPLHEKHGSRSQERSQNRGEHGKEHFIDSVYSRFHRRVAHFPAAVDILRDDDSIIYNDPNQ